MSYPVQRGTLGAPIENPENRDFVPEDSQFDERWEEGASQFPLAYVYPEDDPVPDYAAEQEAADIEATLLGDLEAAATAFWTDFDSDDSATARAYTPEPEPDAAPFDPSQFEFRWEPEPEDLVGPEARRTLIAFRPPRRQKRAAARAADTDAERGKVNFDVHATPDGAFADDLAARNKEFYDLLERSRSAPKITVPPGKARGPGFETVFPRAQPAPHQRRAAPAPHPANGLARQAAAAVILGVIVCAGIFVIAQQFAIPEISEDAIASRAGADPEGATVPLAASSHPADTSDALASNDIKPIDDRPAATGSVDPGTLNTPPLYETPEPAPASVDFSGAARPAPEFAAIPLRSGTETTETESAPAATDSGATFSLPEDPPASVAAIEPPAPEPAKAERESVTIAAAAPPRAKEATGDSQPLRIAAGSGKINTAVNMRAGPDNDARVVRVLGAGAPVDIVACKLWCEVIAGGSRGFVFQRFITRTGGGQAATAAEPPAQAAAPVREEARGPLNLLRFGRPNN